MNRRHFSSPLEGLETISADLAANPAPPKIPKGLPLDRVIVCPSVFQQRQERYDEYVRDQHIKTLMASVGKSKSPSFLDPITIWWGGAGFYLLDGHHRLEAYRRVGVTQAIPVEVFLGTPQEALAKSASGNSRDKLPMTAQEKMNAALRLTLCTPLSKAAVVQATATSESSVKNIRRAVNKLIQQGHTKETLSGMSWKEVDELAKGEDPTLVDIDRITRQRADAIKRALNRALGPNLYYSADALALALSELAPDLQVHLLTSEYWTAEFPPEEPEEDAEY